MKLKLYNSILKTLNHAKIKRDTWVAEQKQRYKGISEDTFHSIYSQYNQRKVKKTFHKHHKKENMTKYYYKFIDQMQKKEKGFLTKMAFNIDFPPTLLARIILEEYFKATIYNETGVVPKGFISKYIKDPSLILDDTLRREIEICIEADDICGPRVEKVKHEIGLKYEKMLHDILTEKGIPYSDEEVLRKEGYDKTPDFKLIIPIGVNNHVVNWIESKASFGDEESHSAYLENQFWSYSNRFGPGLVIYWFGFIEELNINIEQGIMLADTFPVDVITLETLLDEEEEKFSFVL